MNILCQSRFPDKLSFTYDFLIVPKAVSHSGVEPDTELHSVAVGQMSVQTAPYDGATGN